MVVVGVLIVEGLKAAGAASVVLQTTWVPWSEGIERAVGGLLIVQQTFHLFGLLHST